MKYYTVLALFLGVITTSQAASVTSVATIKSSIKGNPSGHSSSESDNEATLVQLDAVPCEYLDETAEELNYQLDMFSRTLDVRHWTNAVNVHNAIKKKSGADLPLRVTSWELIDRAFAFPRVRRYNFVNENMDMLEHFQDNLNTNVANTIHF